MNVITTAVPGVIILEPRVFRDERGFFLESYHAERYRALGLDLTFVQDNHSGSTRNTLRGLHMQLRHAQGKLIRVIEGEIFDVAVDARRGSPTFGHWVGEWLSAENRRQIYVPPGFAHGFCVTSEQAQVEYKCTDYYDPTSEITIAWDDPTLGIVWPESVLQAGPILSLKDRQGKSLKELMDCLQQFSI
jgi:dTDP-4-dehydrorhamnose 3,5-epimerase